MRRPSRRGPGLDTRPTRHQVDQLTGHPELARPPGTRWLLLVRLDDPPIGQRSKRNPPGAFGNFQACGDEIRRNNGMFGQNFDGLPRRGILPQVGQPVAPRSDQDVGSNDQRS